MKDIKPFENEEEGKEGWFGSKKETTGEDYRNYTFYELLIAGIQKWEGVYENQYQKYREPWWNDATTICYDDFGLDGAVSVKIEVCVPTGEHPKGNKVYMFDNREKLIEKTIFDEGTDQNFKIEESYNWSMVVHFEYWSIVNVGTVLLFTRLKSDERKYDRSYKSSRFLSMISHEFGHVWGLKDAYDKPDKPGWHEAKKTKEVSRNNMMRSDQES